MGLSSLLEKAHLSHSQQDANLPATLAPGQGDVSDVTSSSDEDEKKDQSAILSRTYSILIDNQTNFPIQMVAWPVRASRQSHYELTSYRGAKIHTTVPPAGTIWTDASIPLGSTRGPRRLDPRDRWVWIYFDLVTPQRKVHLQAFIRTGRKGVEVAKLGRTDLDSTKDHPMTSGELGNVVVDNDKRQVIFVLDDAIKDVENTVDDSTMTRAVELRGKGIETNSYMSYTEGRTLLIIGSDARYHEYCAPVHPSRMSTLRSSVHRIDGIASRYVGAFVQKNGQPWFQGHVHVHPITGIATGKGFDSTAESIAVFTDGGVINYGFHDAGEGRRNQIYIYATPDQSHWLGDLIAYNPAWLSTPFSRLALPAAHDAGMYGPLDGGLATLIQEGHLGNALASHAQVKVASPAVRLIVDLLEGIKLSPERVINNIALTQKDPFPNQLKIGVRFFDFRPGFCFHDVIHAKKGRIHHQHAMVPGCTYLTFLTQVLDFLATHPSEIVVAELKSDGFVVREDKIRDGKIVVFSMVPTEDELAACFEEARAQAGSDEARRVVLGEAKDLDRAIGELIGERKRLILIDRIHKPDAWERMDSYDHVAYNTDDPATIIAALEKTFAESSRPEPPTDKPSRGCIYQLQATPTANLLDDVFASLTYSDSSSLLTYVKPIMDRVTYPWLQSHKFDEPGNVVLLNDFVEGVLVEHAVDISRQRAGL